MQLTKTDYIQYLNCPESLWLFKNKPDEYPNGEFSLFLQKLIDEGYEVEEFAQKLFPNGIKLPDFGTPKDTEDALAKDGICFFQAAFKTDKGVFARIDILEHLHNNTWHIYEVKSSTSVKTDKKHNHLKDACFQKYVLEHNGYKVSKVSIIHLNKDYIRNGAIDPGALLTVEEVTDRIEEVYADVAMEVEQAVHYINQPSIDETKWSCRLNTRANHCDSFSYFNEDIPEFSIYEIGNIRANKIEELHDAGILEIKDIPNNFSLNAKQALQLQSARKDGPIIADAKIDKILSSLEFPLHFIDYETYASAVPRIDGVNPHQHIPFQVSIHTMQTDGSIEHFEFLAHELEIPNQLVQFMLESTGMTGTFISWHKSFEMGRNTDMMQWLPHQVEYLEYMNSNMFDLEDIFKTEYVDYRFNGSTSIKKVLPVLLPELSYDDLEVQNGTMALDLWGRMVLDSDFDEDKNEVRQKLLEYCKLDTWAMVELFKYLKVVI
jgi:CRISPR/Cas system-associated exonuclease Cas4 (RecB family)